ncbi:MAG: hypothetical protein KAR20_15320, partial [Candidatus Heimdallarchaeota archaeon]|nr:hypothetical protein [Candidatus Heimdallarchaeota archaeon]
IDVEYGANQIHLDGEDLAPGGEYIFVLSLSSTEKGDNIINVAVTGTAYYEHSEDDSITDNSDVYTIEDSSSLIVGNRYVYSEPNIEEGGSINVLLIERALGLLSAIGLIVSLVFSGILKPFALKIEKFVGGGAQRVKLHCRSSQGVMFLSLIHGMLLPFSPHASSLRGLVLGVPLFIIMGLLGYIGWKQNILRPRWGNERWKRIHLILSILAVAIVISHAVLDGTEFAWLR